MSLTDLDDIDFLVEDEPPEGPNREGMTNNFIDHMLRNVDTYKGTYSCDTIPPYSMFLHALEKTSYDRFTIIVNLSKVKDAGTHWVLVCVTPMCTLYMDPGGSGCENANILSFMLSTGRPIFESPIEYQGFLSIWCGLFCTAFALFINQSSELQQANPPNLGVTKSHLNDKRCLNYVKQCLRELRDK